MRQPLAVPSTGCTFPALPPYCRQLLPSTPNTVANLSSVTSCLCQAMIVWSDVAFSAAYNVDMTYQCCALRLGCPSYLGPWLMWAIVNYPWVMHREVVFREVIMRCIVCICPSYLVGFIGRYVT